MELTDLLCDTYARDFADSGLDTFPEYEGDIDQLHGGSTAYRATGSAPTGAKTRTRSLLRMSRSCKVTSPTHPQLQAYAHASLHLLTCPKYKGDELMQFHRRPAQTLNIV